MNITAVSSSNFGKNVSFARRIPLPKRTLNSKINARTRMAQLLQTVDGRQSKELSPFVEAHRYAVEQINKGKTRFIDFLELKKQQISEIRDKFGAIRASIAKEYQSGGFENADDPVAKSIRRYNKKIKE